MRFLCDQMLIRLGRWMRAAGHDTMIVEEPLPDSVILDIAVRENRCLISRDKGFSALVKPSCKIVFLKSNLVEECVAELSQKISIDWLKNPFSRCIICNCPFENASEEEIEKLPERVKCHASDFKKCRNCSKIYWMGTHTDKMLAKLKKWAESTLSQNN